MKKYYFCDDQKVKIINDKLLLETLVDSKEISYVIYT